MHSQKQILLMIVLAALVMRGPINAVGPMAPVVRDVFDLPWEAFGVLAGIPTMAFGLCSLASCRLWPDSEVEPSPSLL